MPFKSVHLKEYGFVIVECAPQNAEVESVSCSFCVNFGREEKPGAKCKATANVMHFKKPFRTDLYKCHLEDQHPEHWKQYQSTSDALERLAFKTGLLLCHFKIGLQHTFLGHEYQFTTQSGRALWTSLLEKFILNPTRKMTTIWQTQIRRKPYQFSRKLIGLSPHLCPPDCFHLPCWVQILISNNDVHNDLPDCVVNWCLYPRKMCCNPILK